MPGKTINLAETSLSVTSFPLSRTVESTVFVIEQDPRRVIKQELDNGNNLGIEFILARQGQRILL